MSTVSFRQFARPLLGLVPLCLLALPASAQPTTVTVTVAGTSNPWLAGMPTGSGDTGDTAPDQSPAKVSGLSLSAGGVFTFAATGSVDYGGGIPTDPSDGDTGYIINHGASNGMSDVFAPADSLVGVFVGAGTPDPALTPATLDFTAQSSRDTVSRSPLLQQVFYIGSGLTGTGTTKQFIAPANAGRLYLGSMDGGGWFNNSGAFTVLVTGPAAAPEPSQTAALGLGVLSLSALALKKRARRTA